MGMETVSSTKLRALGFCGADDSVDPKLLGIIAFSYPLVEVRVSVAAVIFFLLQMPLFCM